jgi:hypothetical protein
MTTTISDLRSLHRGVNSGATILGIKRTGDIGHVDFNVHQGVKVPIYKPRATAIVIKPFVIGITPTDAGFMATSQISNSYELGATPQQAIRNYLEYLVDELIWLKKNQEELSSTIQGDLSLLQNYLRIV